MAPSVRSVVARRAPSVRRKLTGLAKLPSPEGGVGGDSF
jgi:hypothetical protein